MLFGRQLARIAAAEVEEKVDRALLAVVLDLRQQRGHEVERGTHLGVPV